MENLKELKLFFVKERFGPVLNLIFNVKVVVKESIAAPGSD